MPEKLTQKAEIDTLRVVGLYLSYHTGCSFSAWNRGVFSKRGESLNLRDAANLDGGRLNWIILISLCNAKSLGFTELT